MNHYLESLSTASGHTTYMNLLIAVLPCVFLLRYIYRADKLEKENMSLLIRVFLLGIVSIIPTLIIELTLNSFYDHINFSNPIIGNFVYAFFVVALVEEACKYFYVKKTTWNHKEFNCDFDGVVYAVFGSLGFAMLENIMYVFQYGFFIGIMRAILSVPGHMMFSVFFGIQYGKARRAALGRGSGNPKALMLKGLFGAVLTHGLYDFFAFMGWNLLFYLFVILLYMIAFSRLKKVSARDKYFSYTDDGEERNV